MELNPDHSSVVSAFNHSAIPHMWQKDWRTGTSHFRGAFSLALSRQIVKTSAFARQLFISVCGKVCGYVCGKVCASRVCLRESLPHGWASKSVAMCNFSEFPHDGRVCGKVCGKVCGSAGKSARTPHHAGKYARTPKTCGKVCAALCAPERS